RLAAFHDEARHLAERVRRQDGVAVPDVLLDELVVELLLGHDDAHLAHVRASERSDELHGSAGPLPCSMATSGFILGSAQIMAGSPRRGAPGPTPPRRRTPPRSTPPPPPP